MNTAPTDRMLARPEVEALTGLSTSTIYEYMRNGDFPRPIQVGVRAVRWPESEIMAWLADRPRVRGGESYQPHPAA
ncbi:MAG: AlpA family transcriptional regulator [Acidobacteria bacterium]|nr:AlpA family transcriptional regulator [Acidobacteriota bacterium]